MMDRRATGTALSPAIPRWLRLSSFVLALICGTMAAACGRAPREPENLKAPAPAKIPSTAPEKAASSTERVYGISTAEPSPLNASARGASTLGSSAGGVSFSGESSRGGTNASTNREKTGKFRLPDAPRIVAIGDLHGDFAATERAFALAGAIDATDSWIGGNLVVVQTGDQLDRGDDERQIIEFLQRLINEARSAGGALIVLNGNHETMNVMGDFRYVTRGAMNSFADYQPASALASLMPPEYRMRAEPFLPGGGAAKLLSERPLVVMVGATAFVHGGLLPHHVDYGIDRLNEETSQWMAGRSSEPPHLVFAPDGPVWTRLYGPPELSPDACRILSETLIKLGAKRLVVGHTVQNRGMSAACGDRVFRIDVGLSRYYGDHPVQVLEIKGDQVRPLTESFRPEASGPSAAPHN